MSAGTHETTTVTEMERHLRLAATVVSRSYSPLLVVLAAASGAWISDVKGRRYLDCLAAYSANNFGHCHPQLVEVAQSQMRSCTHDPAAPPTRPDRTVLRGPG